jgi:hypothetical protein
VTDDLVLFAAILSAGIYILANGIYALLNPAGFIHAKWTAKRGLVASDGSRQADPFAIRIFGGVTILGAALWMGMVVFGIGQ